MPPSKTTPRTSTNGHAEPAEVVRQPTPKALPKNAGVIEIPAFNFPTLLAKVVGIRPLICSAFPDKLAGQWEQERSVEMGLQSAPGAKGKKNRPARDYDEEFRNSLYPLDDGEGYGFPAIAFKKAMVGACRQVSGLDMTLANRIIFVKAPYQSKGFGCVKIVGTPEKRRDMVRLADMNRTPDIRFRGCFYDWSATLEIEFNASMISAAGIYNLLQYAGKCEGVGEWRPSSRKSVGDNGQFHIVVGEEVRP